MVWRSRRARGIARVSGETWGIREEAPFRLAECVYKRTLINYKQACLYTCRHHNNLTQEEE